MAQKTPLTALTIDYADRWNGTWFVELSIFRYKLIEDYHLRFLITCFLRIKKQWLYLLSVNHSGGFLFLQMMTCYSNAKVQTKPMLFPTQEGQASLKDWQQQFEKKVNKLTIFQKLNLDPWQKRLSVKKQNMWNYLQNTLLLQTNDNLAAGIFFSRMPQHATLSTWFHNKQVKLTLILLAEHINNALIMAQYNNNSLLAVIQQNFIMKINIIKDKMKYLQNLDWLLFLPMLHNIKKSNVTQRQFKKVLVQKRLFSSQQLFSLVKLSNNYPLQIYSSHINVQLKEFQVTTQQQLSVKKVSVSSYKKKELTAYYFSRKKALYQTIYQSKSYLMRRIFAFKQYSSMKEGFQVFFKRFRLQFALRKTLIMLNTPLIFLAQALKRVTGLRQFFSYLPMKWSHYDYKPVKRYTIFERYGTKKYFVPTFVATHLAMSRGSATVLVDLLVHKLRHEYEHTQFLSCVEKICRHLMAPPKSNTAYENVICKGIEILFTGKVNGSDRSKQWRFKLGPVHSSTFYTNTRLEQAKVITKFGSFNLSVRMKLGGLGTRYYSILILLANLVFNLENVLFSFIIFILTTIYIFLTEICMAFFKISYFKFSFMTNSFWQSSANIVKKATDSSHKNKTVEALLKEKAQLEALTTVNSRALALYQENYMLQNQLDSLTKVESLGLSRLYQTSILQPAFSSDIIFTAVSKKMWYQLSSDWIVSKVLHVSGQQYANSAQALFVKQQVELQLKNGILFLLAQGVPVTAASMEQVSIDIVDKLCTKHIPQVFKSNVSEYFDEQQRKLHNSIVRNKDTVNGTIIVCCTAFLVKNQIKSGFKILLKMLPTPVKNALIPIAVVGLGASCTVLVNKMELMEGTVKNTAVKPYPSKGVNSANFPKYYSTSSSSKRYYSTSSLKQKLKTKLNEINISFDHNKKKYFLSFFIFCQTIFFFYFLEYWASMFFWDWRQSFHDHDHDIFLVFKDALDWCYMFVAVNKYNLWNVFVGSSFARSFYFVFIGIGFFYRNSFVFLLDNDNFWLKKFIDKHFMSKDMWVFLNRSYWFNALNLMDQSLIRIILFKLWCYLTPFILNLLFLRYFSAEFFLIGIFITLFAQFLRFLFICYSYLVYLCANKTNDTYLSKKISQNYKDNCSQQFYILLFLNVTYNFILFIVWLVLRFFATAFWLKFLAVIYISLFFFLTILFILYSTSLVLAYSLYFMLFLIFKINFDNLDDLELFLKKRELLLYACFLLCFGLFYYITFMNFLMYQFYNYSLDNVKKKYTKATLLKNYSELAVKSMAKNKSSSSKNYSTFFGSRRFYSNFSFKEKLKTISSKVINYISKQKFFLFVFVIILLQITFVFFFLQKMFYNFYLYIIIYFSLKNLEIDPYEIVKVSVYELYNEVTQYDYFLWNFMMGLFLGRALHIVLQGIFFFFRHKFTPFLLDVDNLWLLMFINKNPIYTIYTSYLDFLNNFNWFKSLTVTDQDLIKVILLKTLLYLYPLIANLIVLKPVCWHYFLLGLGTICYCHFIISLVILFCFLVYSFLIKCCNMFFLGNFPKKYVDNFFNYSNILLSLNVIYNLFLIVFLVILYFFNYNAIYDKLSVIYLFLSLFLPHICFLIALLGVLFEFLYFFMLLGFNINLHNLNENELFIKKSKLFLYFCFAVFFFFR
jgi:hypothetical protein